MHDSQNTFYWKKDSHDQTWGIGITAPLTECKDSTYPQQLVQNTNIYMFLKIIFLKLQRALKLQQINNIT